MFTYIFHMADVFIEEFKMEVKYLFYKKSNKMSKYDKTEIVNQSFISQGILTVYAGLTKYPTATQRVSNSRL